MQSKWQLLTLMATLLAYAVAAPAHQPYESCAVARLGREGLELTVTTSAEIAGRLVGEPMGDAVALEKHRPELLEVGTELYDVTVNGKLLPWDRVFFSWKGGEAVFSIIYPIASADEVRFRAAYLDRLPPGYGGSIEVFDEAGRLLGHQPLLKKGEMKDAFSVRLSAAESSPITTPVSVAAPAPVAAEPSFFNDGSGRVGAASQNDRRFLLVAGSCAVLLLGMGIVWRFHRTRR